MKPGKYYRITFDNPVHDATVRVVAAGSEIGKAEIIEVHSGSHWVQGDSTPLYLDLIDKIEEVEAPKAPVTDGEYIGRDNLTYHRIDSKWYKPVHLDTNINMDKNTDSLVGITLTKVK